MSPSPRQPSYRFAPGTLLGNFRIIERLGRGSTAVVCKAEDRTSGELVALKILKADHANEEMREALVRLRREILIVQQLKHPNICRIYALHEAAGAVFLSMPYVGGTALDVLIKTEGRLAPDRAVKLIRGICEALQSAHDLGILHRDVKPSNVVVRPGDVPSVLDFGFAIGPEITRMTQAGVWIGTLCYSAPELLQDESATERTDQFAVGVMLYQCLAGVAPFVGENLQETVAAVLAGKTKPLADYGVRVPAPLEEVVLRSISNMPKDRFASMSELSLALAPFATTPAPYAAERSASGVTKPLHPPLLTQGRATKTVLVASIPSIASTAASPAPLGESKGDVVGGTGVGQGTGGDEGGTEDTEVTRSTMPELLEGIRKWGGVAVDRIRVERTRAAALLPHWAAAIFAVPDDAVRAAMSIQRLQDLMADPLGDRGHGVRMGLGTGATIVQDNRLSGPAVELASAACVAASPGSIFVARSTYAAILAASLKERCKEPRTVETSSNEPVELLRLDFWGALGDAESR